MAEQQRMPGTDNPVVAATYVALELTRMSIDVDKAHGSFPRKEDVATTYGDVFKRVREQQAVRYSGYRHEVQPQNEGAQ